MKISQDEDRHSINHHRINHVYYGTSVFYAIELGQTNDVLRFIKNMGTFVGLSGMGVTLAGILLYLINRNEPPIQENFDIKNLKRVLN